MSIERCKEIISQHLNMEGYNEVEIDFFGGEPFLEFATIKEVCEWVWSREWKNKYIFFATTNGVLITGVVKEWLRKNRHKFWVSRKRLQDAVGHKKSRVISPARSFSIGLVVCPGKLLVMQSAVAHPPY